MSLQYLNRFFGGEYHYDGVICGVIMITVRYFRL